MASTNPARGMRDFLPSDVRKRNYVIGIIKEVYESYGFEPLETPAVENIETLMGKYGDEGNQLIFKILKRGEKLDASLKSGVLSLESESFPAQDSRLTTQDSLSDLALRYDLTVPLARVVANNKNNLPKFFKRYQIQPVWRADRPARGRFREFYQCDVDCIGSESMVVEAELISAVCEILNILGFDDFIVRVNHRDILDALLESIDIPAERWQECIAVLDKVDKIGLPAMIVEIGRLGFAENFTGVAKLIGAINSFRQPIFREIRDDGRENGLESKSLERLNEFVIKKVSQFIGDKDRKGGLKQITALLSMPQFAKYGAIEFVPTLARGLSYYTGCIMEIVLSDTDFAVSLAGGGRYDGLIGMFGKEQIPACGFSLGLERILVVMEERGMFPSEIADSTPADVMVTIWSEETVSESLKLASELRAQNLRVTVYPEADKLGKQLKYADTINVPWVCVLGDSEIAENKVTLKNMQDGDQETTEIGEAVERILIQKRVIR